MAPFSRITAVDKVLAALPPLHSARAANVMLALTHEKWPNAVRGTEHEAFPRHDLATYSVTLVDVSAHDSLVAHDEHDPEIVGVPNDAHGTARMVSLALSHASCIAPARWVASAHTALGGVGSMSNGLGTTTVALATPIGSETFSDTVEPSLGTAHADEIGPADDVYVPDSDAGPRSGCTRGATATSTNPGAAAVIPAKYCHDHCPTPPHRKMWLRVPTPVHDSQHVVEFCVHQ
mmetsp:Transcript_7249/g.18617  ORF Transcript_7249/g.18617 Transcript_7249/m.18617 type:complete len:234 (-) Transcript_7249:124-825(-)|eukprot:CAMPEP_0182951486 /NCGR_PEP_ID=MMETSP0105_2-20130417/61293_1 /TAXON_ID=81532 ORGANISM="Acanthoeca-like sp., Strain 10tr" /NCGR_SAMPLE_ID=MMETSP0105_2 /ASSEMBLY_ACC=CAM_ASM_000205 /LENGTH=233 /DNA_ID=CAMNT_0025091801 /DNA_START=310 /DNA_END=1011 /DNA_ORIENTATION=+